MTHLWEGKGNSGASPSNRGSPGVPDRDGCPVILVQTGAVVHPLADPGGSGNPANLPSRFF